MPSDTSAAVNGVQSDAPALPLFYNRIELVDTARHADLRLTGNAGYRFAARTNAVLMCIGEFQATAQFYPIVFAGGEQAVPLTVLGFRNDSNLFVGPDGKWMPDVYIPAYIRRYPFIFVQQPDSDEMILGIEMDPERVGTGQGTPLFEDGKPSQALRDALGFCSNFQDQVNRTQEFAAALQASGILQDEQIRVEFRKGGTAQLNGFRVINPAKFDALDDATILDWRRRGWLPLVYAHFHSMGQWRRLVDIAGA